MNCRFAIEEIIFGDPLGLGYVHILSLCGDYGVRLWGLKPDFASQQLLRLDKLLSISEPLFARVCKMRTGTPTRQKQCEE